MKSQKEVKQLIIKLTRQQDEMYKKIDNTEDQMWYKQGRLYGAIIALQWVQGDCKEDKVLTNLKDDEENV